MLSILLHRILSALCQGSRDGYVSPEAQKLDKERNPQGDGIGCRDNSARLEGEIFHGNFA
jgi:hypothetical protein